jgi:uncharacterized protein
MKIGVISDTHGSISAWKAAVNTIFRQADLIIHAGDVLYHGPRNPLPGGYDPGSLAREINGCAIPLLLCRGNCDSEVDQMVLEVPLASPYLFSQFGKVRIWAHHGHLFDDSAGQSLSAKWGASICITGHTHVWSLTRNGGAVFLNPGSPALPKDNGVPTVGMVETGDGETIVSVRSLDDESTLARLEI